MEEVPRIESGLGGRERGTTDPAVVRARLWVQQYYVIAMAHKPAIHG